MIESLLKLCLPVLAATAYYFWQYGVSGFKYFKGWGAIKLLGIMFFLLHLTALIAYGEEWFCGTCLSKYKTGTFLFPSAGYSLLTFSGALSGNLFDTIREKLIELFLGMVGLVFILIGIISILGYRHHSFPPAY